MDEETPPRAMGYVCIDLVETVVGLDLQVRRITARFGYEYIGLTTSCSLVVPEELLEQVAAAKVELLIVPGIAHLRGRIPPELAALTDIHDLEAGRSHERGGGYAPDEGWVNPLVVPAAPWQHPPPGIGAAEPAFGNYSGARPNSECGRRGRPGWPT